GRLDRCDRGRWHHRQRGCRRRGLHVRDERGELREDRRGRAEPDDGVHDGQAQDQGRYGRRHEAPEDLLVRTDRAETTMIWIALLVRWGINTLALIVID